MSYPLKPVPPHPGPRPPRWRFRARRRWRQIMDQRVLAKEWNFGWLYGAGPKEIAERKHYSVTEVTDILREVVYGD